MLIARGAGATKTAQRAKASSFSPPASPASRGQARGQGSREKHPHSQTHRAGKPPTLIARGANAGGDRPVWGGPGALAKAQPEKD
jgi:hypothetical protein